MTKKEVLDLLATIKDFASINERDDDEIKVTIWDDGTRISLKNLDKIDDVEGTIAGNCLSAEEDLYTYYDFEDFEVIWGYESFDE